MSLRTLANADRLDFPRMPYMQAVIDPAYDTHFTRITPDTGTPWAGGTAHTDSRHHYSKDQPWNDDMTLVKLQQKKGTPGNVIVSWPDCSPLFSDLDKIPEGRLLRSSHETRWRPGYPTQMVSVIRRSTPERGISVVVWDVLLGQVVTELYIKSADKGFGWIGEGQISDDGRYTLFNTSVKAPHAAGAEKDYLVIADLEAGRVGPRVDVSRQVTLLKPRKGKGAIGNCGISCLGNYAEVKLSSTEQFGYVLDIDKDNLTANARHYAGAWPGADIGRLEYSFSHPDTNMNGKRECVVGGVRNLPKDHKWRRDGNVWSIDLGTGEALPCSPSDVELGMRGASMQHGSGRAYRRRGWHLVSMEMGRPEQWGAGEIMWVKLDGSGTVERLGLHRSYETGVYRAEAQPCASPDGKQVMYASNDQGLGGKLEPSRTPSDVKAYVCE